MRLKKMIEIILISLGGIITIGLSINSILQRDNQEKKLKESQDSLNIAQKEIINKQKEINVKSEKIISLQEQLNEKSESQIIQMNRLNAPIPKELNISFSAIIKTNQNEFDKYYSFTQN